MFTHTHTHRGAGKVDSFFKLILFHLFSHYIIYVLSDTDSVNLHSFLELDHIMKLVTFREEEELQTLTSWSIHYQEEEEEERTDEAKCGHIALLIN